MSVASERSVPWVEGRTIGQVLQATVARRRGSPAMLLLEANFELSYTELGRLVGEAAAGLLALGVRRGDHVAIWATNRLQWVITQFAAARLGAVLVNINPAYRSSELDYVLRQSDTKLLLLIDRFKGSDYVGMLHEVCPELGSAAVGSLQSERLPKLETVVFLGDDAPPGMISWNEMLERGQQISLEQLDECSASLEPADPINIQYTSGTTGFPKGAVLTHRSLLLNAYYTGLCQRLGDEDRICIPVPFYHCFGCVLGTLSAVVHGAAMIVPAEHFDPGKTLEAIERYRATSIYGVPTMFIAQLEHSSYPRRDLSSLRSGIMAGSPCPIELMRRVTAEMGARELTIAYGLTEFSPVITQTRPEDPIEKRVETVGRPLPGVAVRISDPASGRALPPGQPGELWARGHGIMAGYYRMPEQSATAIDSDGWLHTGDLAVETEDGYYRITGRIKDMVIRGGENIYPREVEEFLYTHPKIEDAQVIGVPDPRYGEELAVWVKLKAGQSATEQEVREFCRGKIAHYKVPRYVKFVSSFPMTVTGKIQKFRMRELMIEEISSQESGVRGQDRK